MNQILMSPERKQNRRNAALVMDQLQASEIDRSGSIIINTTLVDVQSDYFKDRTVDLSKTVLDDPREDSDKRNKFRGTTIDNGRLNDSKVHRQEIERRK